jgi:hypothetical protein
MALSIEVKVRSGTLTSAERSFIQVWSRKVKVLIQITGRIARPVNKGQAMSSAGASRPMAFRRA